MLLVIVWLLQIAFLQYFYIGSMARENMNNAREIVSLYKKGKLTEEEVYDSANKNNIIIIVTDEEGFIIHACDYMGRIDNFRVSGLNQYVWAFGDIQEALKNAPNNEIDFRVEDEKTKQSVLFYAAIAQNKVTNENAYIYVMSQLGPIYSVITVMQKQFVTITLIALLMSAIIAYVIANRFSRPVEKLTKSARELAMGNTDVDFETDDAFGEISDLSKALTYATGEIAKSAEFRRELMANVSHDLRTPLTMIKMYAEMIRDISGDNKEKREKNLKIIIDETDRLSLLVNDILELSKIEAADRMFNIKAFDISQTVTTILERFSVMREQGYIFELEAPEQVYVLGDEARIEQVLYNLLSNAINYTGDDKRVIIKITKGFDCAKIEIIDTGNGIPEEELANIWDRYYRSKTHIRSQIGTGLGLSIVKTILIGHNSDFGIESTIGVGSNFWFELKLPENSTNKVLRLADNNIVSDD